MRCKNYDPAENRLPGDTDTPGSNERRGAFAGMWKPFLLLAMQFFPPSASAVSATPFDSARGSNDIRTTQVAAALGRDEGRSSTIEPTAASRASAPLCENGQPANQAREQERLERNKQVVTTLMKRLFDPATGDTPETRALMTESYIQHNPNFPNGPDGIFGFLKTDKAREMFKTVKFAGEPTLIAQGDYVVMMQPVYRPKPGRPGETFISYWFDMWRMENGRAAEHWDYADWDPEIAGKLSQK